MVLSVDQAASMLGCKRRKVFELLADGTLERAPRYGREIRIYTATVVKALTPRGEKARRRLMPPVPFLTHDDLR